MAAIALEAAVRDAEEGAPRGMVVVVVGLEPVVRGKAVKGRATGEDQVTVAKATVAVVLAAAATVGRQREVAAHRSVSSSSRK